MYSKTNPGDTALSPRRKRVIAVAGAVVVLGLGGAGAWAAFAPDALSGSANGCVNVTVPSATGGATMHYCGAQARSLCHDAFRVTTAMAMAERPPCRAAGLAP